MKEVWCFAAPDKMKIVFHENFLETYTSDPAASYGRLEPALELVTDRFPMVTPAPCSVEDVLRVHTSFHLEDVQRDSRVYPMAMLAAGATINAADLAMKGEPAFALCRPPGHHASPDSCWGFCYFNNIAVATSRLLETRQADHVLIIDFDLHFGDGTSNIFSGESRVTFWHVSGRNNTSFVQNLEDYLEGKKADIVAVSAGFDRHANDWGGMLTTEDYGAMGEILGRFARENCGNRIFAALEGGYNARSLGNSVLAFTEGIERTTS